MVIVLLIYIALLGLVLGSFSNVVIHRVPLLQSLVSPPSRCTHCQRPILYRDNVPVVSWVVLGGRCRHCRAAIGARYPIVEAGTALLFVAVTIRLHDIGQLAALPAYLYFAAMGVVLALIDLDTRRLPDIIVLPSYGIVLLLLAAGTAGQGTWTELQRGVLGGAALFSFYLVMAFAYPAGMGFGDVKLSGIVGGVLAYLSWDALVVGAFAGFLLGAVAGVAMILLAGSTRKSALPFGPFMIAGAFVGIFVGDGLAHAYLNLSTRI